MDNNIIGAILTGCLAIFSIKRLQEISEDKENKNVMEIDNVVRKGPATIEGKILPMKELQKTEIYAKEKDFYIASEAGKSVPKDTKGNEQYPEEIQTLLADGYHVQQVTESEDWIPFCVKENSGKSVCFNLSNAKKEKQNIILNKKLEMKEEFIKSPSFLSSLTASGTKRYIFRQAFTINTGDYVRVSFRAPQSFDSKSTVNNLNQTGTQAQERFDITIDDPSEDAISRSFYNKLLFGSILSSLIFIGIGAGGRGQNKR